MTKRIAGAILGMVLAAAVVFLVPSTALVTPIDGMLRLSTLGGAEKENVYRPDSTAGGGHGIFNGEALAVIPTFFLPPLGIQFAGDLVAANAGWRAGFNGGPVFDFGMGKAGLLFAYQFRHYQGKCGGSDIDLHGAWVRPAVSFYLPQTNINAWISQGISPRHTANACENDRRKVFVPVSEFHVEANYFPPLMLFGRDNLELSLGVTVQNLWGMGRSTGVQDIGPVNVGPSAGVAFMPWQNLEVTLARGWFDVNHNKYKVMSGLHYYFNFAKNPNLTLLQNRRQYLEPTLEPGTMATFWNRN
jgi:hypothetical protein